MQLLDRRLAAGPLSTRHAAVAPCHAPVLKPAPLLVPGAGQQRGLLVRRHFKENQTDSATTTVDTRPAADKQRHSNANGNGNGAHNATSNKEATKPVASHALDEESSDDKVNWYANWWPVVPVKTVDRTAPIPVDVLGMQLVIWNDGKTWHCFEDKCPHRLAPLSEGRIEGGQLACSYHGWVFNDKGTCTSIPQIEDSKACATATASGRSCVKVFPVQEVHGLLWVWTQGGAQGAAAAAAEPVPKTAVPALLEAGANPDTSLFFQSTEWFMRDMPLRFETLVENVLDPSHVHFAHRGAMGVPRTDLINPHMTPPARMATSATDGFMVTREAVEGPKPSPQSTYGLIPPNLMSYVYPHSQSHFYCIPTKPGWSRIITCMVGRKDVPVPAPLRFMASLMNKWPVIEHVLLRHDILDGDMYMLHVGERALLKDGNKLSNYYMPANADAAVVLWRKWLQRHAGDIPTCTAADVMPPQLPKEQVLDRWHQHTRNCPTCQSALKTLDRATNVTAVVGVAAAVALLARVSAGAMPLLHPGTAAGALLVAACYQLYNTLKENRKKFFYVEYVHSHR